MSEHQISAGSLALSVEDKLYDRIEKLESFHRDLEKKLFAAFWVAVALGVVGLVSGAWVKSLSSEVNSLTSKTEELSARLENWDAEVDAVFARLDQAKVTHVSGLQDHSQELLETHIESFSTYVESSRQEIQNIDPRDLLAHFYDGSIDIKARTLTIVNDSGVPVFQTGSDSGGDGYFKLNSESGQTRYQARLSKDNPVSEYWNSSGQKVLVQGAFRDQSRGFLRIVDEQTGEVVLDLKGAVGGGKFLVNNESGDYRYILELKNDRPIANFRNSNDILAVAYGVFGDGDNGFFRLFDPSGEKSQVQIVAQGNGGRAQFYADSGKNIVYIGPDSQTGNGLVNVMGLHGESTNSHAPK